MPRWFMLDVAFSIWSPLMIDGPNRYATLWSVEQVTRGRVGSSLPARMSFLSHWVAWNCRARNWMPWRVLCRQVFSSAMRSARSLRGAGGAGAAGGGGGGVPGGGGGGRAPRGAVRAPRAAARGWGGGGAAGAGPADRAAVA